MSFGLASRRALALSLAICCSFMANAEKNPSRKTAGATVPPGGSGVGSSPSIMNPSNSPDDDHISCELSEEDLLKLRPRPEQPTLNEAQVEFLKRQVINAIAKAQSDGKDQRREQLHQLDGFLDWLSQSPSPFDGLTFAQAQNSILNRLAVESKKTDTTLIPARVYDSDSLAAAVKQNSLPDELEKKETIQQLKAYKSVSIADLSQLREDLSVYLREHPIEQINTDIQKTESTIDYFALERKNEVLAKTSRKKQAKTSIRPNLSEFNSSNDIYSQIYKGEPAPSRDICSGTYTSAACESSLRQQSEKLKGTKKALEELDKLVAILDRLPVLDIFNATLQSVADATHKTITAFAKPDDVGCAIMLLPWNSMRYMFGQKVADEFLGVQITVRNLNGDKEFLLHDAELGVDMDLSGPSPRHSRFFSGVDKQNVRAYMLAARDYDNRSLFVHSAEAIVTLIGSAAPIWGGAVTDASSVLSGGFIPSLTHVWTDHHTDQLNELNDAGFSASRNDRTFVPKSGSTQFVIFVPVQPMEQAWWTQGCVQAIPLGSNSGLTSPRIGLDIDALRDICIKELQRDHPQTAPSASGGTVPLPTLQSAPHSTQTTDGNGPIQYFNPLRIKYQKWSPTTYALLKELSFAVIAGTHVTLNSDTHPDITQLDCPHTAVGDLDFFAAKSGSVACTLSGVNFDKVDHLTLRSVTDTQTVDIPIKAANGGKVATLDLKIADLCPLKDAAYKLYTVTANGIEDGGTQSVHLSLDPFLTDPPISTATPPDITDGPVSLTLKGCHLDHLKSIRFGDTTAKSNELYASNQDPGSAIIEPTDSNKNNSVGLFKKWPLTVGQSKVLNVFLISNDDANPKDSKQSITVVTAK